MQQAKKMHLLNYISCDLLFIKQLKDSPRGRIIEEARHMVLQGYSKVLMADLARRLGMS